MPIIDTISRLVPLTEQQTAAVSLWESDIRADIATRALAAGTTIDQLDPVAVDRFVREAVLYRLAHPDDATQVDVQVDDARVSKRYSSSTGQLTYLDSWWAWLGLDNLGGQQAFTITPFYESDAAGDGWDSPWHRRFR